MRAERKTGFRRTYEDGRIFGTRLYNVHQTMFRERWRGPGENWETNEDHILYDSQHGVDLENRKPRVSILSSADFFTNYNANCKLNQFLKINKLQCFLLPTFCDTWWLSVRTVEDIDQEAH